jgi:hypothetical protein
MKRVVLSTLTAFVIAALAIAMTPAAAKADQLDFGVLAGGSWSWNSITSVLSASSAGATLVAQDITTGHSAVFTGTFQFTTGAFISGAGTSGSPYQFGGNSSSTAISFVTNAANGTIAAGTTLFSGTISGASVTNNGGTSATLNFVLVSVNSTLLSSTFLNASASGNSYSGTAGTTMFGSAVSGGSGTLGSTDVTVTNVPEPGTLLLFGSGLVGLAGVLRRKIQS